MKLKHGQKFQAKKNSANNISEKNRKRSIEANVMITIFSHFQRFAAGKMAFFLKPEVMMTPT
jgi:hypothetical protein